MSLQHHYRPINPRLGTHYAIFVSAIVALVIILAMLEQLGTRKLWLSHIMITAPPILYAGVAVLTRTLDVHEFFAAGRRVPAVFGGLSLAVTAIGGSGFFAITGCLYLIGFDALALVLGIIAGFVVMAILFTSYLRKSGAYTLPSLFRQRFNSRVAGAVAAVLVLPPMVLLLAAEIRIGAFVTSLFVSVSFEMAVMVGAGLMTLVALLGGMRSVSWTQCIQYLVVIGAFLLPIVILSVQITNLPLPQLTYGELFDRLSPQEFSIGATKTSPGTLEAALPGERPEPALKPFLAPFGALSKMDFLLLAFCFMAGTAAMPSLLMRAGTAPTIFEARRAIGWGALFLGLFLVSAPAYAAFAKFITLQELAGVLPTKLPDWIAGLRDAGLADVRDANNDGTIGVSEMLMSRDGVTLALPIMAEYPFVMVVLVATGGISAALAAGCAHALAVGATIGEDLFRGLLHTSATPGKRLAVARLGIIAATLSTAWIVALRDFDILPVVAWAMSLAGSTFLPGLVLSLWWPRMTVWGLIAALVTGFAVASVNIGLTNFAGHPNWLGISDLLAAVFGIPASLAAGIAVSLLSPRPPADIVMLADEIRDPSGETIQDRAVRLSVPAVTPNETEG